MPVYVYEVMGEDGQGLERFEIIQSMKDEPLKTHPETGQKIRRVLMPPNIATRYTPGQTKSKLANESVEKAGFTKYERDKLTGKYHRVAGSGGPSVINKPQP